MYRTGNGLRYADPLQVPNKPLPASSDAGQLARPLLVSTSSFAGKRDFGTEDGDGFALMPGHINVPPVENIESQPGTCLRSTL